MFRLVSALVRHFHLLLAVPSVCCCGGSSPAAAAAADPFSGWYDVAQPKRELKTLRRLLLLAVLRVRSTGGRRGDQRPLEGGLPQVGEVEIMRMDALHSDRHLVILLAAAALLREVTHDDNVTLPTGQRSDASHFDRTLATRRNEAVTRVE